MQNLEPNFKSPLAVVAHDAGAANLILGWLKYNSVHDIRYSLKGPALDIFLNHSLSFKNMSVNSALKNAAMLLSGTSSDKTDLEHKARLYARKKNILSIGVLDHWINYGQRFTRNAYQILPNEIWVTDDYALTIAKRYFPNHIIYKKRNSYLDQQIEIINSKYAQKNRSKFKRVLYLLEPIGKIWGDGSIPGEFEALDFFVKKMSILELCEKTEIILKPHPNEESGKYSEWISLHSNLNIQINIKDTLSDLIASADIVVGCQTSAMVVALYAKKYTVSTIPPLAPSSALPHKEIIMLRDLKE